MTYPEAIVRAAEIAADAYKYGKLVESITTICVMTIIGLAMMTAAIKILK